MTYAFQTPQAPAVVSRLLERVGEPDQYLIVDPQGAPRWTSDPRAATTFDSMREAMRTCARLPGAFRAFGLPLRGVVEPAGGLN